MKENLGPFVREVIGSFPSAGLSLVVKPKAEAHQPPKYQRLNRVLEIIGSGGLALLTPPMENRPESHPDD